jgi:hypothetical protein
MRNISIAVMGLFILGCADYERKTTTVETVRHPAGETVVVDSAHVTPPPPPAPAVPTLDQMILNVQNAPDGQAEAAALRQLHGWLAGEQMTFQVATVRPDTGEAVAQPTLATIPLRASVSIFNKMQPYRDFGFQVKDNRNLTILGLQ